MKDCVAAMLHGGPHDPLFPIIILLRSPPPKLYQGCVCDQQSMTEVTSKLIKITAYVMGALSFMIDLFLRSLLLWEAYCEWPYGDAHTVRN